MQQPFGVPPLHGVGLCVEFDEPDADHLEHPFALLAQFILALVCRIVAPVSEVQRRPRLLARRLQVDQRIGPQRHPAQPAPVPALAPARDTVHHRPASGVTAG